MSAAKVGEELQNLSVDTEPSQEVSNGTPTTVLHSGADFSVVHPLTHEWTLWYTKPPSGAPNENWADLLKELVTISTVEEFWGVYNSIPKVSELPVKGDYALFKKGIRPEWEDPKNAKGGKWIAQLQTTPETDERWLNVLLSLIGGTLDNDESQNEQVSGVFGMVRRGQTVKVQLWVQDTHSVTKDVASRFKDALDLQPGQLIEYNGHLDGRKKSNITL